MMDAIKKNKTRVMSLRVTDGAGSSHLRIVQGASDRLFF